MSDSGQEETGEAPGAGLYWLAIANESGGDNDTDFF